MFKRRRCGAQRGERAAVNQRRFSATDGDGETRPVCTPGGL